MVRKAGGNTRSDGIPRSGFTVQPCLHTHTQVERHGLAGQGTQLTVVCVYQCMSHGQTASHGGIMTNAVY